jgi:hypothetical protein
MLLVTKSHYLLYFTTIHYLLAYISFVLLAKIDNPPLLLKTAFTCIIPLFQFQMNITTNSHYCFSTIFIVVLMTVKPKTKLLEL